MNSGVRIKSKESLGSLKHTYSHFKLTLHVYLCHIPGGKKPGTWVPVRNLHLYPMSRLHRRIAQTLREIPTKCSEPVALKRGRPLILEFPALQRISG